MAQFAYRARDRRGGMISGVMSAVTQEEVAHRLHVQGMNLLSVMQRGKAFGGPLGALAAVQIGKPRVKQSEVVLFANQLAVMVDTGVPLSEALEAICQQTANPTLREILKQVAGDVEGGEAFSEALEKHPKQFNSMFVSLVRAGESAGNLGEMLTSVAEYLVDAQDTRRKVRGALAYPAFMVCLSIVVVVVLLTFVLPKFTAIYARKGAVLPMPTKILLAASQFCTGHWVALLIALFVLAAAAVLFFRQPVGRRFADTLKLRLPVVGGVWRKYYMARTFRALGTMISAGVPVISALEIARRTVSNTYYVEIFDRAIERVSEGETLSDQFFSTEFIPVTTAQMVFAGEKSGQLGAVLLKVSRFCDGDLKGSVKNMTTLLEPALIAGMGFFVGGVAISLLLPMFTINKAITK